MPATSALVVRRIVKVGEGVVVEVGSGMRGVFSDIEVEVSIKVMVRGW